MDFLCRVFEAVIKAGAKTINVPDTVGYSIPELWADRFKTLLERVPNADQVVWSTHCHNDLGMAVAISKGEWQRKGEVVAKWLAAASKMVDDVNPEDADRSLLEIQLCRGALAAAAGSDVVDPLPWVKRLLVTRDRINDDLTDAWQRRQVDWEVGLGLADALSASQKRGEASDLLDNATLTVAYLERGAENRELTEAERASVGDLLFRIGVLHSLQNGDHATAVTWFDKAQSYWDRNGSFESHGEVGRLGESYVSMAVSYWQVDRRDDALDLCRRGIDCMVTAVDNRLLDEPALALAYGNLSMMYAEQGEDERSKTYAEMASRAEASAQRK
jgi:tetratricopeptide (TPR) repeat protein